MKKMFKAKKILVLLMFLLSVSVLSGCTYFYPAEQKIYIPELIEPEKPDLLIIEIQKGDIVKGYLLGEDDQTFCEFVNDPTKTTFVNADIEEAYVKQIYVSEGDFVKEGDILIEYEYEFDKDTEFLLNIDKRRAELKYEKAVTQLEQGKLSSEALELYRNAYSTATSKLDEFYALEEKYTLRAPCDGTIVEIEGYSVSSNDKHNVTFQISNIEDGIIIIYADSNNDVAAFPLYIFSKGSKARISNEELGIEANAYVKYNNTDFKKNYEGYLDTIHGSNMVYMELEFEESSFPESINFNQTFTVSLIQKEIYDVVLVPRSAVEETAWDQYYVYKLNENNDLEKVIIEIGENNENYYEVKEGLEEGNKVLIR
ncbi:MAG TPA: efflux RND transporter periplasmic adaptor subunit [Clostridia bacterium]|nr:efflux RND transporter periplasmic adaptor subunit [Clostridia bacterium]